MDASSIVLQGLQQAQLQFDLSAQRLASLGASTLEGGGADTVSLSGEAVSLLTAKNQFVMNVDVLKIASDMQKSVVDIVA